MPRNILTTFSEAKNKTGALGMIGWIYHQSHLVPKID